MNLTPMLGASHTIRLARKIKFSRESASEPHLDMKGAELG